MDPFTALMIGGTALQIYGNVTANLDQAKAEAENSIWMKKQADFMQRSTQREVDIFNRQSQDQEAGLENAFAKSGISITGTAFELKQQEEIKRNQELQAIVDQGSMNMTEALMKSAASQRNADNLKSFKYNAVQTGTTLFQSGKEYSMYKAKKG